MRRVRVEPRTGCWLWTGTVSSQGYGREAGAYVHRSALEVALGRPLAPGMVAAHSDACASLGRRGRLCCNPAHLSEKDQIGNAEDRERTAKARRGIREGRRWT